METSPGLSRNSFNRFGEIAHGAHERGAKREIDQRTRRHQDQHRHAREAFREAVDSCFQRRFVQNDLNEFTAFETRAGEDAQHPPRRREERLQRPAKTLEVTGAGVIVEHQDIVGGGVRILQ